MTDDAIIQAFNDTGPAYRRVGAPLLDLYTPLIVERAEIAAGQAVIDIATGPGTIAEAVLPLLGARGSLVGIDLAERQLSLARERVRSAAPVRFARMDAAALDFQDKTADATFCGFGLPYFSDPLRSLREMARVTRGGGAIIATAWGEPFFGRPGERLLATFEHYEVPHLGRGFRVAPEDLAGWCFRAGLEQVRIEEYTREIAFANFDAWWEFNRAFGFLVRLDAIPAETREQVRAALAADIVDATGAVLCTPVVYLLHAQA